uniref:glucuronosyltransferase n=1 Tax=Meloidogyne hapla TaxID=6305 RepID=A0A1I8BX42_MELHA
MHDHWKRLQEPVIRAEFGADFPDLNELVKKSSLVFINSNPFFDMPRPISNKIIYIGGLVHDSASPDSKILDKRTKNILDGAKEGAILFSFGSIADTSKLKNHMRNSIINAFRHFPKVQFIWKLDKETIKNLSELLKSVPNVHTFTWIRQAAILGETSHPNLKAFITHCGQNSLTESFRAGVPVIGLPLFADQFYNADLAQKHGIGLQIPVNELNGANAENLLIETIERILADRSFRQKAQIIAKKVQITPFDPKERLVKWVEFAAEFDNLSELDLPGANEMNWFAYYSIDVILFSTVIMLILLWLVWKVANGYCCKVSDFFWGHPPDCNLAGCNCDCAKCISVVDKGCCMAEKTGVGLCSKKRKRSLLEQDFKYKYTPLFCRFLDKIVDFRAKHGPKPFYYPAYFLMGVGIGLCIKDEQKRELYAPSLWRRRLYDGPFSMHTWMLNISAIYQCTKVIIN